MDLQTFHTSLLAGYPTPEQARLYQHVPEKHGFDTDQRDKSLFLATFVAGLYLTRDWDSGGFREVHLIVTRPLEGWVVDTMNLVLQGVRRIRAQIPKTQRLEGNRLIVKAVANLVMGSRPFSIPDVPKRWVCFGYTANSPAPEWLKEGLLPTQ